MTLPTDRLSVQDHQAIDLAHRLRHQIGHRLTRHRLRHQIGHRLARRGIITATFGICP